MDGDTSGMLKSVDQTSKCHQSAEEIDESQSNNINWLRDYNQNHTENTSKVTDQPMTVVQININAGENTGDKTMNTSKMTNDQQVFRVQVAGDNTINSDNVSNG